MRSWNKDETPPVLPPWSESVVFDSAATVKTSLLGCLSHPAVIDFAFIGNSSSVYEWVPCALVDLDCFIFARALSPTLGLWLADLRDELTVMLDERGISFELRIIEGPYKPSLARLSRPVIVVHLGVFTEAGYRRSPVLKRWAWRKYACERESQRLLKLAPDPPGMDEFVRGAKGLDERLKAIRAGSVAMNEWLLPSLRTRRLEVSVGDPAFQECCFAYCANSARNHARALGCAQADVLGNAQFFTWYHENLFRSDELLELMKLKAHCRDVGFDQDGGRVRQLALTYLESLRAAVS